MTGLDRRQERLEELIIDLSNRQSKLEGIVEQLDKRLTGMDQKLNSLDQKLWVIIGLIITTAVGIFLKLSI